MFLCKPSIIALSYYYLKKKLKNNNKKNNKNNKNNKNKNNKNNKNITLFHL